MFIVKTEDENIFVDKYTVEYNLDDDTYSLWLFITEDGQKKEVDYGEFYSYDQLYRALGQLRMNYINRV
jgi:hypothetical protein